MLPSTPLPQLNPHLRLFSGSSHGQTGEPSGTLYDPLSNRYFKLSWAECECLSRLSLYATAEELIKSISIETTLTVEMEDIENICHFIEENGLSIDRKSKKIRSIKEENFIKKLLHNYLYISIPLWNPQNFLNKTYPFVKWLFSLTMTKIMSVSLVILMFITMQRANEFFATNSSLLSFSSMMKMAVIFAIIKLVHEWSHAYTATKYNVPVPHMGVSFIVLYPVLYTETSGAWRLTDKWKRIEIGLAGIKAELYLATLALVVWNISPTGSIEQAISYMVIIVSLVSSLLINLNPLMRFDGYYVLSDLLRIENLQNKSCIAARYKIREILLGLKEENVEYTHAENKKFIIIFGLLLLIYRAFLFTGIAILIYHMFFQPLGLVLFCIEIWFFILKPIIAELKIWKEKLPEIFTNKTPKILLGFLSTLIILAALPVQKTVTISALSSFSNSQELHGFINAEIEEIHIKEGENVSKNQILITLISPELNKNIALANQEIIRLETKRRGSKLSSLSTEKQNGFILDEQMMAAKKKKEELIAQRKKLIVKAPFGGQVRDMLRGIEKGRVINEKDILCRIIDKKSASYVAYVSEIDHGRIKTGDRAIFFSENTPLSSTTLSITSIESIRADTLNEPEMLSEYGGNITTHKQKNGLNEPVQSQYKVILTAERTEEISQSHGKERGIIHIKGEGRSVLLSMWKRISGLIIRELGWV